MSQITITDSEIVAAMKSYGGSFIQQLAKLYEYADGDNRRKIITTWAKEWDKYKGFAETDKANNCKE